MKETSPPLPIIPKLPLFLLALIFLSTSLITHSLTTDGVILLAFKLSINDPLNALNTWNPSDIVPCSWQGVSCSVSTDHQDPRVITLSLPNSNLHGSLPSNLGLLTCLQILNLANNSINGSIPDTLFSLPDLRVLDLSNNLISGGFSDLVGGLRSLETLDLSENALDGIIPRNLAGLQSISSVSLRGNYFSGNIPGGFYRVRVLDLSSNIINGSLPVDFGGGNIGYFNISYNKISGEISPEFYQNIPENATLDFSHNNLTGEIPGSGLLRKQGSDSFTGNPNLCGPPLENSCSPSPSPSPGPTGLSQVIPSPAIAAKPRTWSSSPATAVSPKEEPQDENSTKNNSNSNSNNMQPRIIAAIVVGDLVGIAIISMVFLHVYRSKKNSSSPTSNIGGKNITINPSSSSSSFSSSSSSESKGLAKWSCLRKGGKSNEDQMDNDDEEEEEQAEEEVENNNKEEEQGKMVTLDGEVELEVEELLKASAYILGVSGTSIMYKAVLENGTVLAVRRVGDCISNSGCGERFKDFETHVRAIAKLTHPNLVRVRAFYWAAHEKLLIYEYLPYGSLANARPRKAGSSPCHMSWEIRLRIARGVARGLAYIHDKKQVHGNLKPSNILLDHDMEPKIGDFGLDRLTTGGKPGSIPGGSTRHFGSKRSTASRESLQDYSIGATPSPSASSIGCVSPYHPPESLRSLKPNPKWDVYSFGVILLELLTGKVVVSDDQLGPPVLAGLAVGLEDKTRILRMADVSIRVELDGKEESLLNCLKLGYNCISNVPQKRPSMKEALQTLEKVTTYSSTPSSSSYYGP